MTRRMILLAGLVGGAVLLAACAGSSPDSTPATTVGGPDTTPDSTVTTAVSNEVLDVSIENFLFDPADLTVAVGETIRWTNNESGIPHDTTADDGLWESPLLQPGDDFEFTFAEPGTYTYFCAIHPNMKATITVTG